MDGKVERRRCLAAADLGEAHRILDDRASWDDAGSRYGAALRAMASRAGGLTVGACSRYATSACQLASGEKCGLDPEATAEAMLAIAEDVVRLPAPADE